MFDSPVDLLPQHLRLQLIQMASLAPNEQPLHDGPVIIVEKPVTNEHDSLIHWGRLMAGEICSGEEIRLLSSGKIYRLTLAGPDTGSRIRAEAGRRICFTIDPSQKIAEGEIITSKQAPLESSDQFEAILAWTGTATGHVGRSYLLKLGAQVCQASITDIKYKIDTEKQNSSHKGTLNINELAICKLACAIPLHFEQFSRLPQLGSFQILDSQTGISLATGLIRHSLRRGQNIHRQALSISRSDRERLNKHPGKVIWFTGLSGSGKSTLANELEKALHARGKHTYILDGDNIRHGLNKDLGFTDTDRVENIRRVAEVAKLMLDAGLIVMTAFISPFRQEREMARNLIGASSFIEVFVDTPLCICEERDPKGLYRKARSGKLPNMTGVDAPYEAPHEPSVRIDTSKTQPFDATRILINLIEKTPDQ